ncbi:helix-turn-helix domain-containing protein [Brucella tritici]|uniref:helix-turn-helix domain-containing protein n=1 Tax=Brucella tritici TaxID=94626 RepID=UPI00200107C0|nr:helix-turn-helix domain-containing protein [Brucella tritici]
MDQINRGHEYEHPLGAFRGYNPACVKKVHEKRRKEAAKAKQLRLDQQKLEEERARQRALRKIETDRVEQLARLEAFLNSGQTPTVRQIIRYVALKHGLPEEVITGPSRTPDVNVARHEAMCEAHLRRPDISLPKLAREFKRDHTTIHHTLVKHGVYQGRAHKQAA